MHSYIFAPTREMWPASSVNARIAPIPGPDNKKHAGERLARPAQSRRANDLGPGLPMLIRDRLIAEGGWIERSGVSCFNLYRAPTLEPGDAAQRRPLARSRTPRLRQ